MYHKIKFTGVPTILVLAFTVMSIMLEAQPQNQASLDIDITRAVENQLEWNSAAPAHLIDVKTREGVVTLSGSVGNILSKDHAERIARKIRGVVSVVNNIEVRPVDRTDEQLKQEVQMALYNDPATEKQGIDAKVEDKVVTMNGKIESWAEKKLSEYVVKSVRGVREVKNNLEVEVPEERSDEDLMEDIKARLRYDIMVDHGLINVIVNNGEATLTGIAGSAAEKSRAETLAHVPGVKSVDATQIEIQPWSADEMLRKEEVSEVTDGEIKEAIESALLYDPRVYYPDIDVTVDDGVVTLTGKVDSMKGRMSATQTVNNTVGVKRVINKIHVRPEEIEDNQSLGDKVRNALERDPYLERFDILVTAENGKVFLRGAVDTYFEKKRATEVASRVKGVVDIYNALNISKQWQWKEDRRIRKDVEENMKWDCEVNEDNLIVTVDNGVATINGTVDTWWEEKCAVNSALEAGAKAVESNLNVRAEKENFPQTYTREFLDYSEILY